MSYEGFEQHICENGHRFDTDCQYVIPDLYDAEEDKPLCPYCKAKSAWYNPVDDTNCDQQGVISDWSSLLISEEITETCNLGHIHVVEHATYRIPTDEEAEKLRQYYSYGVHEEIG